MDTDLIKGESAPAETYALTSLRRGRGAVSNPTGRFEPEEMGAFDDGWLTLETLSEEPLRTTLGLDTAKTVITRNKSPDVPFERSLNPYRGCEHVMPGKYIDC